ncbi:cytochrome P450 family protein [Teratosphaeria nubilosa]|uniref:Cytochrome P450 family protein n=1 Tax=Teratosphaeria nubilosa TaxID=161662 RepID=A0A6G1L131_9PEZI|nr:cytochrome P450 family protein [Teratosphaeria nubilosa]
MILLTVLPLLAFLAYTIHQHLSAPLAKVPGPFLAKLTNIYRAILAARGKQHREYIDLHRKYGKVVRVAPGVVSIADPDAYREIYKAGNKYPKAEFYGAIQGDRSFDLFGQQDERIHAEQRKLVARAYSMDSMVKLEPAVEQTLLKLLDKLDGLCGQEIDLGAWLQLYAFDVIGAISFSRDFGYIDAGTDAGTFARIKAALNSAAWVAYVPWLLDIHQRLRPVIGNWLAMNDRNGYFHEVASKEVEARKGREGDERDVATQLLTAQREKPQLTTKDIGFMMTSNVIAGSDTTSNSLRAMFYLLLSHPEKLARLMEELEEKKASGGLNEVVTAAQAEACPYLQAVMWESVRLYPVFSALADRKVPARGLTVDGHYLPADTTVGCHGWVISRLPEVWGPDADEFRPERWLDKERYGYQQRYMFSFGGGSRTCIGKNIAWLEMEKLVPTLLMRYDFRMAPGTKLAEESG